MQNETASEQVLREFLARMTFNLSALIALVAGAVNVPDLILLLMR